MKDGAKESDESGRWIRVRLHVEGRVQGVFFRASARSTATRLGIHGWVRNLPDGTVEAVAEGREEAVESFSAWCQEGPPGAIVTNVRITREAPEGKGSGFEVRYC